MISSNPRLVECPVLATEANFDEQEYLLQNPDIAAAVARGVVESGYAHFQQWGRTEGRRLRIEHLEVDRDGPRNPFLIECPVLASEENFDEQQYLYHNPDVAAAVARGDVESGFAHFRLMGRAEGRLQRIEYLKYESQQGLSSPLPNADLIYLVAGHRNYYAFDICRRAAVETIVSLLSQAEVDSTSFRSILDLGCGCGRILAGWEGRLSPEARFFGCDINSMLVDFCQKNLSHAEVIQNSYYPPLPYQDDTFDFIYAISVYTHLTLPAMLQWTGEIARILKPGGICLISTHGSYYCSSLASLSKEGSAFLATKGYYVHLTSSPDDTWKGSNNYATYVSSDFLRRLFVGFDLKGVFPGISHGPVVQYPDQINEALVAWQDISIFMRS